MRSNAGRHALIAVLAMTCWACSARRRFPEVPKLQTLAKLDYLPPLAYSPHYGIFQELEPKPWGEGKVLAAYWRKDFGYESELRGLSFSQYGPLVLEMTKESGAVMHRFDAAGVTVSSMGLRVQDVIALRGRVDRVAALSAGEAVILGLQGETAIPLAADIDRVATGDLDGDGQDEVIVRSWKKNSVSAYRANGKRLWTKDGFNSVSAVAAGRLEADRSGVLIAGMGADFKSSALTGITASGKVFLSTPLAWSEAAFAHVADLGDGPRLVTVGHVYPNDRQFLKVARVGKSGPEPIWQADLGWTTVSALASADLNGDGRREILVGTKNGWILVFSAEGRALAEKNVLGEITAMDEGAWYGVDGRKVLVAVKGIPPMIFAVGVIPDPGPWRASGAK